MASQLKKRAKDLTATQQVIMNTLGMGPASINDIAIANGQTYATIYRPLKELVRYGYVERDSAESAFQRSDVYRVKRAPDDGIEFVVKINGEQRFVSFNALVESMAGQTKLPKVATQWRALPKAFAMLMAYAAIELETPGSITEADLLDPRAEVMRYCEALEDQLSLGRQLLHEERLWDPTHLPTVLKNTDRLLSVREARECSRAILEKFVGMESDDDTEGEESENDE